MSCTFVPVASRSSVNSTKGEIRHEVSQHLDKILHTAYNYAACSVFFILFTMVIYLFYGCHFWFEWNNSFYEMRVQKNMLLTRPNITEIRSSSTNFSVWEKSPYSGHIFWNSYVDDLKGQHYWRQTLQILGKF